MTALIRAFFRSGSRYPILTAPKVDRTRDLPNAGTLIELISVLIPFIPPLSSHKLNVSTMYVHSSPGGLLYLLLLILPFTTASPQMSTVTIHPTPNVTVTVTVTAPPTIPSKAPQFHNNATFVSAVLNSTNLIRKEFNASALAWNQTLANFSSDYLESMGRHSFKNGTECNFSHSGGPYGENLALGCTEVTGCVELCELTMCLLWLHLVLSSVTHQSGVITCRRSFMRPE